MSRYIDADAYAAEMKTRQDACLELMNAAREMDNEEMYGQKSVAFSVFVEAKLTLDAMPTVDAVPVVRCKECIHRPKMPDNHVDGFDLEFPDHKCPCQCCDDGFYSWYPADDWFCADGERRTE